MASTHTPISSLLTPLLRSFRSLNLTSPSTITLIKPNTSLSNSNTLISPSRAFSTTRSKMAGRTSKSSKKGKTVADQRIALIRYHMQHALTPRPLRLSRMRALRHWTIHRAWMLARRQKKASEALELQRQYQSIHSACEELRLLDPPGTKDSGRLYRIAMEKKGTFGYGGVPIEYARLQVDTPAKEAWNHGWKR